MPVGLICGPQDFQYHQDVFFPVLRVVDDWDLACIRCSFEDMAASFGLRHIVRNMLQSHQRFAYLTLSPLYQLMNYRNELVVGF